MFHSRKELCFEQTDTESIYCRTVEAFSIFHDDGLNKNANNLLPIEYNTGWFFMLAFSSIKIKFVGHIFTDKKLT